MQVCKISKEVNRKKVEHKLMTISCGQNIDVERTLEEDYKTTNIVMFIVFLDQMV